MQFHFPQYVDIEDKVFGPLTIKQAIFVAGGLGAAYFVYRIFTNYIFIAVPIIAGIAVLTWALAFFPKERLGRPFIEIVEAWLGYMTKSRLYTWKRTTKEPSLYKEEEFIGSTPQNTQVVSVGKLSSRSFELDTKSNTQTEEDENLKTSGRGML